MRVLKDTFSAWIDKQPGGTNKFIVKGEVEVPTGGWKAVLKPAIPPGFNPNIIILELVTTPPTGNVTQVITNIPVRYEEAPPKQPYTDATIRGADEFTIKVKTVQ